MVAMEELVQHLVERGGSDLHISAGSVPLIRVGGSLVKTDYEQLDGETTQKLVYSILDNDQILKFEKEHELDMAFGIAGLGRFRTNVFYQRGAVGAVLRVIPSQIPAIDSLGLPKEICEALCQKPKGLVLVTGATGSGKSTTLAAMVDFVNLTRSSHIMTIEDPIEFVHKNKSSLVNQREVGADTHTFKAGLRTVLRQDPDVIMIGEMRDMDTIEAALTIAETGHLTFATLHTSDVVQTINRIIDVFPAHQQQQVRTQLSFTLEGVFCQQLIPRHDGRGRALACEVMTANQAVRALIREDKIHQIHSVVQTGGRYRMQTMNQALFQLYRRHEITYDAALSRSPDGEDLKRIFQRQI